MNKYKDKQMGRFVNLDHITKLFDPNVRNAWVMTLVVYR